MSHGISKVLHCFGFSFRHLRDALFVVHFVAAMFLSVYLWRRELYREWCVFLWAVVGITALQAFVFLPNQRFKTILFDYPAILVAVLGLVELFRSGQPDRS